MPKDFSLSMFRGVVDKQKDFQFHQIKAQQVLGISIRIKGFSWSRVEYLNGPNPSLSLALEDKAARILKIDIENR